MGDAVMKPAEAETPALSFPERLIGVFISPGETFADVARKPGFIAPLVSIILLAIAGTEVFLHKIGMEPVVRWAMEHSSRTANMPADQLEATLAKIVPFYNWMARVGGIVWPLLVVLVGALVGLIAVNSIFGGKIKFKTAFSISSYAYAVNIIYYLLAPIMIFFGDPDHYVSNPQNPAPTSVGFFLNPLSASKPLLTFAGAFELFTIWNLVLLAVGFSAASGRKAKPVPLFLVLSGLWMVKVLISAGLATLG